MSRGFYEQNSFVSLIYCTAREEETEYVLAPTSTAHDSLLNDPVQDASNLERSYSDCVWF